MIEMRTSIVRTADSLIVRLHEERTDPAPAHSRELEQLQLKVEALEAERVSTEAAHSRELEQLQIKVEALEVEALTVPAFEAALTAAQTAAAQTVARPAAPVVRVHVGLSAESVQRLAPSAHEAAVGERCWMLNPLFRDGTKLRAGPGNEDALLDDQYILNDEEVLGAHNLTSPTLGLAMSARARLMPVGTPGGCTGGDCRRVRGRAACACSRHSTAPDIPCRPLPGLPCCPHPPLLCSHPPSILLVQCAQSY